MCPNPRNLSLAKNQKLEKEGRLWAGTGGVCVCVCVGGGGGGERERERAGSRKQIVDSLL